MEDSPNEHNHTERHERTPAGPMAAIVVVVILLAIAGVYFFIQQQERLHQTLPIDQGSA